LKQVQSSAGLAVFVSEKDDPKHWVEAGRCYERFALLQATTLGIRNAFLNMPDEVADVRPDFAASLGLNQGAHPDLVQPGCSSGLGCALRERRRNAFAVII
jgi:hypothetical protein